MQKKILSLALVLAVTVLMSASAFADLAIKPVPDPWDDPSNQESDGASYYAYSEAGYVVVWETPECNVDGKYVLVKNNTELTVEYRVTYMESVPWGHVNIELEHEQDNKSELFSGWVLMSDLVDANGKPAAIVPPEIPDHPMIANPVVTPEPTPTTTPSSTAPTPTPTLRLPQRPDQAITVSNTYNSAIVYTSVAIAIIALALVVYVLIKHKALNKKGE